MQFQVLVILHPTRDVAMLFLVLSNSRPNCLNCVGINVFTKLKSVTGSYKRSLGLLLPIVLVATIVGTATTAHGASDIWDRPKPVASDACEITSVHASPAPFGALSVEQVAKTGKKYQVRAVWAKPKETTIKVGASSRAAWMEIHWLVIDGKDIKPPNRQYHVFRSASKAHTAEFVFKIRDTPRGKVIDYGKCKVSVTLG